MAKIKDQKKGRRDGGFTRVFDNEDLGALISQTHATSVSNGTELEKIIIKNHTNNMDEKMFASFTSGTLQNGTYLIPKTVIKSIIKQAIGSKSEPDFIVIVIVNKRVYVVEVKDGDAFDTKKSAGEVASCRKFAKDFAGYLIKCGIPHRVEIRICCFNQTSKQNIVDGFKSQITISEAWTGQDFCSTLGISYTTIAAQRRQDGVDNINYFLDSLIEIPEIKEILINKLSNP